MKFIVLLFGATGFTLVILTGYVAEREPDLVLRDAALGCLAMALVGRWFASLLGDVFAQTLAARREQQRVADEKATPPRPTTPTETNGSLAPTTRPSATNGLPAPIVARAR